jgi:MFS transporter, SET family, sugar efflux transporter
MTSSDHDSAASEAGILPASPELQEPELREPELQTSGVRQILRATARLLRERDFRVLLLCSVILGLASSMVAPYLSLFATREVGMSLPVFGGFMMLTVSANILISTLLARRSDHMRSRRPVLILGSAAGALGYLGYALLRNPWLLLLIGTLILGLASLTFSQLFAHARERLDRSEVPTKDAPLYMNAFRMAYAAAWTVGPALAALTLGAFSFRGLFLGAALIYVLLLGLVLGFVRPSLAPASQARMPQGRARLIWAQPRVLPWFVAFILAFAAQAISMGNMSLLVLEELGGTETQVGIIFSLAPLFELPFMLYFGFLATRVEPERLIRLAFGLAVLYYGSLSLVQAPWHIYPLQVLSAAMVSVTSGVAITFFQNKLPGQFGTATNLYVNAMRIGSTSGYLLFGNIASRYGHRGAYVACTLLSLAALLSGSIFDRLRQLPVIDAEPG